MRRSILAMKLGLWRSLGESGLWAKKAFTISRRSDGGGKVSSYQDGIIGGTGGKWTAL